MDSHSPHPEVFPAWGLTSSTSAAPDTTWYQHLRWIQRLNWSPRFIHKAAACSSQDVNHLETKRAVPSLITAPLTQYLHSGDIMTKTVGFPLPWVPFGCADPGDLPKDGKLICVIWKSTVRRWTYTTKFFYMCRDPAGIQQQTQKKVQQLLKRSQVCQWANSPQMTSILYNYECMLAMQRVAGLRQRIIHTPASGNGTTFLHCNTG